MTCKVMSQRTPVHAVCSWENEWRKWGEKKKRQGFRTSPSRWEHDTCSWLLLFSQSPWLLFAESWGYPWRLILKSLPRYLFPWQNELFCHTRLGCRAFKNGSADVQREQLAVQRSGRVNSSRISTGSYPAICLQLSQAFCWTANTGWGHGSEKQLSDMKDCLG